MSHLTLEQLVELREPGLEPGLAAARDHLAACSVCQAEQGRLDQRVARLRALPALRPARNHWSEVRQQLALTRRRRTRRWAGVAAALMLAAAVTLLVVKETSNRQPHVTTAVALDQVMAHSSALEHTLQAYNPDRRILDGATAGVAGELEDRIALLDQQLQAAQSLDSGQGARDAQLLRLWRERVGLLNALVDVHLTRASKVGM